ncbi:MAG: hypothetical protein KDB61_15455, partial [Planctomycetes bacterium]|nr:hypothetical protein [Planctomycetota bacterium]
MQEHLTKDGLIAPIAPPTNGRAQGWTMALTFLMFGIGILGTAAIDALAPVPPPKISGGEKAQEQRKREEANFWDGSLARLIEDDYRQRSRVRQVTSRPYANFLFRYLQETNSSVLMGSSGWMFITRRVSLPESPDDLGAKRAAAFEAAISRRLRSLGMRHVLMPIPRKSVVYGDKLPVGFDPHRAYDEAVVPAMRAKGIETIDLLAPFEKHRDLL